MKRIPGTRPRLLVAVVAAGILAASLLGWAVFEGRAGTGPAAFEPLAGQFTSLSRETTGTVRVVKLANGQRRLVFKGFKTHIAPELYVYLVPGTTRGGDISGGTNLGRLRTTADSEPYTIPADAEATTDASVVVWCEACKIPHGQAALDPS